MASTDMLDVGSQHIWSGWKGKCVKGMKMDSSYLSDPMTIVSYAMSAYSSYTYLNNGTSLFDQVSENFGETLNNSAETTKQGMTAAGSANNSSDIANSGKIANTTTGNGTSLNPFSKDSFWDTDVITQKTMQDYIPGAQAITVGRLAAFGISAGMQILAPTDDGRADLKYLRAAAVEVAKNLSDDAIVVIKSTVPVGTSTEIRKLISENTNKKFHLVNNPEFLNQFEQDIQLKTNELVYEVFSLIGNDTACQCQNIDRCIERGIDISGSRFRQPELRRDKQCKDCHHNIEAETLSHISQSGSNQTIRVLAKHKNKFL
jgi:hypothetical protein